MKTILNLTRWQPNPRKFSGSLFSKLVLVFSILGFSFNDAFAVEQTVTISPLPVICSSTTSVTFTASVSPAPAEGPVQFVVDGINAGPGTTSSTEIFSYDYNPSSLSPGSHSVTAIYTDPSGATITSAAVALLVNGVNPGLVSKGAGNQGSACGPFNPSITLATNNSTSKAATGSGAISYLWQQSSDGITWSLATITLPEISNSGVQFNPGAMSSSTWLRRVATSTLNSVGCSANSNTLFYEVFPSPVVSAIAPSGIPNICEGSTIQLTNSTAGGVWSSNNLANVTVSESGKVTGVSASTQSNSNVSYTVTNSHGCSKSVNKTVRVIATPVLSAPRSLCAGQTFNLTPSTGGNWISNNENIATVTPTGQIAAISEGSVTFTFTNSASPNCSKTTEVVTILSKPLAPTLTISNNCDGTSTLTASEYDGVLLWSTGENSPVITVTSAGTYTISQTQNGCTSSLASGTATPKQKPEPPAATSPLETCVGKTPQPLEASGTDLLWYDTETSGEGISNAPVPDTGSPGTLDYFVSQTVEGCESEKVKVSVTVKEDCSTLPVTLIEFTAYPDENNVILFWKTAYEMHSSSFEIERSADPGRGFTFAGFVTSKNKSDGESYVYRDITTQSTDKIYYRLKMIDLDGTYSYSRILAVNNKITGKVVVFPNPVSDYFQIAGIDRKEISRISIRDIDGNLIRYFTENAIPTRYNTSKLTEGSYLIEIEYGRTRSEILKMVIAR